ncbi:MAG: RDD family protein [Planctomycetes bacterium]|nr:RDD family protein [Planctomycetota bacterium]
MRERLDTLATVEAPEGVELSLRVAGLSARALAFGLDLLVRLAIFSALGWLALFGDIGQALLLLALFAVEWFYPVVFEVFWNGQTLGKRVLGLAVVRDDGTSVGWSASVLRNFLRVVDFLPGLYGAAVVSTLLSRDGKRIGDHVAGTLVVHVDGRAKLCALPKAEPCAPPIPLAPEEQAAVIEFAVRSGDWSPARREELAAQLAPLTGASEHGHSARVLGMARWLEGAR